MPHKGAKVGSRDREGWLRIPPELEHGHCSKTFTNVLSLSL